MIGVVPKEDYILLEADGDAPPGYSKSHHTTGTQNAMNDNGQQRLPN
jgi:hypothetical protein